jgi:PBSX family phage portal protein
VEDRPVSKAYIVSLDVPNSNKEISDLEIAFSQAGALTPPYDPKGLCLTFERSSILRPNVDAYEVNIERAGFRFDAAVKLEVADVVDVVRRMMVQEALADGQPVIPTDEEVAARIIEIRHASELELNQLKSFFRNCAWAGFSELRARMRQDLEITGNAYWEVIRDAQGDPYLFEHLESCSMRLMAIDRDRVEVDVPRWVSECAFIMATAQRRFRRFVQIVNGVEKVFFKELGDPRVISSRTNAVYESEAALAAKEPNAPPATEVLHFATYCAGTAPYGVPRWIGAAPAIRGARGSEDVNARHFADKGIPNGILSVSGGDFGAEGVDKIQQFFRESVRGVENYHKVLILEVAAPQQQLGGTAARPEVKFDPLAGALQKDGIFQEYEKNSERKVGEQYRLPGLFRGDSAELNRATADTAVEMTNTQVFGPERQRFDEIMNTRILPLLGIRYWRFVSGPVAKSDPVELVDMVVKLVEKGVLTINEARRFASEALGHEFRELTADWANKPLPLLIKGDSAGEAVKSLVELRTSMAAEVEAQTLAARRAEAVEEVELEPEPAPSLQ